MRLKNLAGVTIATLILGGVMSLPTNASSTYLSKVNGFSGAAPKPTLKSLVASSVGFRDESYCAGFIDGICDKTFSYEIIFRTTWAFSVTNSDSSKSATHVRAQLTFKNASGDTIYQTVASIPGEIKPKKTSWAATNSQGSNGPVTGVASITAKIVAASWGSPSKSITQAPAILELGSNSAASSMCPLGSICSGNYNSAIEFNIAKLNGILTWRGKAGTATGTLVYFDAQGLPIGGTTSFLRGEQNFKTGSNSLNIDEYLTPKELSEISIFKIFLS
jgi:hypothetical protein